jgi:hypothetical protein
MAPALAAPDVKSTIDGGPAPPPVTASADSASCERTPRRREAQTPRSRGGHSCSACVRAVMSVRLSSLVMKSSTTKRAHRAVAHPYRCRSAAARSPGHRTRARRAPPSAPRMKMYQTRR